MPIMDEDTEAKTQDQLQANQQALLSDFLALYDQVQKLTLPELEELLASVTAHGTDHEDGQRADDVITALIASMVDEEAMRRVEEAQEEAKEG